MGATVKPGEKAPRSGQYEELGPRGGRTGHEVTISKRERVPPTRYDDLAVPDVVLGLYDWVLAWDHGQGDAWLISTGLGPGGAPTTV